MTIYARFSSPYTRLAYFLLPNLNSNSKNTHSTHEFISLISNIVVAIVVYMLYEKWEWIENEDYEKFSLSTVKINFVHLLCCQMPIPSTAFTNSHSCRGCICFMFLQWICAISIWSVDFWKVTSEEHKTYQFNFSYISWNVCWCWHMLNLDIGKQWKRWKKNPLDAIPPYELWTVYFLHGTGKFEGNIFKNSKNIIFFGFIHFL